MLSRLWKLAAVLALPLQAGCSPPCDIEALLVVGDIETVPGD